MQYKRLLYFTHLFLLIATSKMCRSDSISSLFHTYFLSCNQQLIANDGYDANRLDLLTSTSLCLSSQNPRCIGVACHTSTKNCKMIQKPANKSVHCVKDPGNTEEQVFMMNGALQEYSELALTDLELGRIMPTSSGISPISTPPIVSHRLQIQFGNDILICSETSMECQLWIEGTNQWNAFPSLSEVHIEGSMSIIGDKPLVIGGKFDGIDVNHGTVEIYDPIQKKWIIGPPLVPIRRTHTTVVLNETSLLVVGGYNFQTLNSVQILDVSAMSWNDMDDLPMEAYAMVCGVFNLVNVLCIGGEHPSGVVSTAVTLDMSLSNPTWKQSPLFDTEQPIRDGFIFHIRNDLLCMSLRTTNVQDSRTLRRMNLAKDIPSWEVVQVFSDASFAHVSPYMTKGYMIKGISMVETFPEF